MSVISAHFQMLTILLLSLVHMSVTAEGGYVMFCSVNPFLVLYDKICKNAK